MGERVRVETKIENRKQQKKEKLETRLCFLHALLSLSLFFFSNHTLFFSLPPSLSLSLQAGLAGVLGLAGGPQNVQGEDQKKLDILANDVFISCLGRSGQVAAMVSEEDDAPIAVEGSAGDYVVVFDPLDGSSNIDCGVSIGTIFGVYRKSSGEPGEEGAAGAAAVSASASSSAAASAAAAEGALRPGRDLVAAGYCLYGSSCMLVLCLGETPPSVFTLDPSLGEFLLTQSCVRVPERGSIYSINEGNSSQWDDATTRYVTYCKSSTEGHKPYSLRYIGEPRPPLSPLSPPPAPHSPPTPHPVPPASTLQAPCSRPRTQRALQQRAAWGRPRISCC